MTLHKNLTGADLHEPKGVETATSGQAYIANGSGSGAWSSPLSTLVSPNVFYLNGTIDDVSTAGKSFFRVLPVKAILSKVQGVLSGTLTVANDVLTVYKNGVAQTPTITVAYTGSGAGIVTTQLISPTITFLLGDTVELRTAGGSTGTVSFAATLTFTAST